MRCWCLNFGGRVRLPSARNFQLCMPEGPGSDHDPARVILQFGKVRRGHYARSVVSVPRTYPCPERALSRHAALSRRCMRFCAWHAI